MLKDLPQISYNGVFGVSDITTPIHIPSNVQVVQTTQQERSRADVVADKVYGNDRYDYMVLLANQIIDPLQFPVLSSYHFDQLIIKQYGSVENAQQTTVYWENNWRNDQSNLTPAIYNSLPREIRQLYDVQKNFKGEIAGYVRKKLDIRKSTSQIVTISTTKSELTVGSYVSFFSGPTTIGSGRVRVVTATTVIVNDIIGSTQGTTFTDGKVTSSITMTDVFNVIQPTEVPYYSPVTLYDQLLDRVAKRRTISVFPQSDLESIKQKPNQ